MGKVQIGSSIQQTAGLAASMILLVCPAWGCPLPSELHDIPTSPAVRPFPLETQFGVHQFGYGEPNDLSVIQTFALEILSRTEDLDEEIGKAINVHFWELYESI